MKLLYVIVLALFFRLPSRVPRLVPVEDARARAPVLPAGLVQPAPNDDRSDRVRQVEPFIKY